MNLLIILRTEQTKNLFRDIILDSIGMNISEKAYLCSGFFQELKARDSKKYQASTEKNFSNVLRNSRIKLITLGIHNAAWKQSYINFIRNLRSSGVTNLDARITYSYRWHAKIFILEKDRKNILGIIGSSNITRPAFSDSWPFNYECDVVLWDDSIKKLNSLLKKLTNKIKSEDVIKTDYILKNNSNISIHNRLEHIKKLLMDNEQIKIKELEK